MKEEQVKRWREIIDNGEKWMKPKREEWDQLQERYNLELKVAGLEDDQVQKVSRFYPLVRRLIASIAYNYPRIFASVDQGEILQKYNNAEEVIERAVNNALKAMGAKEEIHQAAFDALFCYRGFLKVGYNPQGDDAVMPYVSHDDILEDFPYIYRVDPRNIIVDPLCAPHKLGTAEYVIERMMVPLEFVKSDPRFENFKNQFRPLSQKNPEFDDTFLTNIYADGENTDESSDEHVKHKQRELSKNVLLYEIHDRVHRRRIVFANGIEEPVEDIPHPMLKVDRVTQQDPMTGQERTIRVVPKKSYLLRGAFPYYTFAFDMSDKFWGKPMMAYEKAVEQIIVESLSRRTDLLKRFNRIIAGNKAEKRQNPNLPDNLSKSKDGDIHWFDNPDRALMPLDFGGAPQDQIQVERDALAYEGQIIEVSPPSGRTATEAAVRATDAQLNREWMQVPIAGFYKWATESLLAMWSDVRYRPEKFSVVLRRFGEPDLEAVIEDAWFTGLRYDIEIDAGSMQVLNEQLERDDTLALYDRLIASPVPIDRKEVVTQLLGNAFRKVNFNKLLEATIDPDAAGLAQMENVAYLLRGQNIPPQPGQNHQTHMQLQDINQIAQSPEFKQAPPQLQQAIQQAVQEHNQQHQQLLQQEGGTRGRQFRPSEASNAQGLMGTVRSNAQKISNVVQDQAVEANAL